MARFQSTFIQRLDKKGRASVPAAFREQLVADGLKAVFVRLSDRHPAIDCFGQGWADKTQQRIDRLEPGSPEHEEESYLFFGRVSELSFDTEGRILLPAALIEHARLTDRAAFVGLGDSFAIWEPAALERFQAEAAERSSARRGGHGGGR